jgi:hypothetical protein
MYYIYLQLSLTRHRMLPQLYRHKWQLGMDSNCHRERYHNVETLVTHISRPQSFRRSRWIRNSVISFQMIWNTASSKVQAITELPCLRVLPLVYNFPIPSKSITLVLIHRSQCSPQLPLLSKLSEIVLSQNLKCVLLNSYSSLNEAGPYS